MAVIGTLAVSLTARSEQFVTGVSKAVDAVGRLTGSIPGLNALFSKTGAVLGALAAGGFAALARAQAQSIDQTAKLADRIGTTTEELVGLQHAGELAGGGAEQVNAALQKLSKGLGEAAEGSGSAKDGLAKLGLSIDALLGKDPAEQFRVIAEGISHLSTQEEKAAAATDLFGKAGGELVNVLELGRAGLDAMQKDAEKLGLTFSRVDAAKVEAANDALTRVHGVIQGVLTSAVIELAPYVEAIANKFTDWATEGEGAGAKVVSAIEWVVRAVQKIGAAWQVVMGVVRIAAGGIVTAVGKVLEVIAGVVDTLTDLAEWLPGVDFSFDQDFVKWADGVTESGKELVQAGADMVSTAGDAEEATRKWFEEARAGAQATAEAVGKAADEKRRLAAEGGGAAAAAAAEAAGAEASAKAAGKKADHAERERAALEERVAAAERIATLSAEDKQYATEIVAIEKARADGWDDLADRMQKTLDTQRAAEGAEEISKKVEAHDRVLKAMEDETAAAERIAGLTEKDRQFASEIADIEKARAAGFTDLATRLEAVLEKRRAEVALTEKQKTLDDERRKAAEEEERKAKAAADLATALSRELELLQAANDLERERITIRQELADNIEKAGKNLEAQNLAQAVATEKLKKATDDAAASKTKAAKGSDGGGSGGGSDDGRHWVGGHRKQNAQTWSGGLGGGTSMGRGPFDNPFGGGVKVGPTRLFGAGGPTEAEWAAEKARRAAASTFTFAAQVSGASQVAPVAGVAAAAGGSALPDASPGLKAATDALDATKGKFAEMVKDVTDLADVVVELSDGVTKGAADVEEATSRATDTAKKALDNLKALKESLAAQAVALSGA